MQSLYLNVSEFGNLPPPKFCTTYMLYRSLFDCHFIGQPYDWQKSKQEPQIIIEIQGFITFIIVYLLFYYLDKSHKIHQLHLAHKDIHHMNIFLVTTDILNKQTKLKIYVNYVQNIYIPFSKDFITTYVCKITWGTWCVG